MISEVTLNIDRDTNKKYIYGGLFDFYADTEENLKKLTDTMCNHDLFSMSNAGACIGLDDKSNRYWTLDDGKPSIEWLLEVFKVIQDMNKNGDDITITISKKFLLYHEAIEDLTLEDGKKPRNKECLIDVYIYHLKEIMDKYGYNNLLKTQVKGKLRKSISSRIENDLILID